MSIPSRPANISIKPPFVAGDACIQRYFLAFAMESLNAVDSMFP